MAYKNANDPRKKEASRRYYEKNRARYLAYSKTCQDKYRKIIRQHKAKPCADCGESYPYYVMDFDHRPHEQKAFQIARVHVFKSIPILESEIAKCDVVCSNCHRERTQARVRAKSEPSENQKAA